MTPATRHISPSARHISPSTRLPLPPTVNHSATARATKPPSRTQQMMEQIRASIEADKLRPKREPRSKFAAHSKLANVVPLNVVISPAKIETTQGEVNSVSDVTSEAQTTLENNLNSPQQCEAIEQENERDGAKSAAVEESERSEVKNEICREEAPPAETEPLQHKQQQQQQQQQEVEDGDEQNGLLFLFGFLLFLGMTKRSVANGFLTSIRKYIALTFGLYRGVVTVPVLLNKTNDQGFEILRISRPDFLYN